MRSKPLNPNSMSLIMESFRKFIDEHDDKNFNPDTVQVHLFEGKSTSPTSQQSFNELLSEYKDNKISEEVLLENWRKHLNEQRDQRPRTEPTPFKSKAQKRYKKKRKKNDIYSTISGHKNLKT